MRFPLIALRASLAAVALIAAWGCGSTTAPPGARPVPSAPGPTGVVSTTVTTLSDSGPGSLRAAIQSANTLPAGTSASITFAVNGTITLASGLPPISAKVIIDGTTAPTYAGGAPVVELDANRNGGLVFAAGSAGSRLLGLAVDDASGNGVTLEAGSIALNHDYIGLNLAGAAFGNAGDGVYVAATSSNDAIGSNASSVAGVVANVISGNAGNGVSLHHASGNTIAANRIGTDAAGTVAIGNGANGIWITAGSSNNEIGGTAFVDAASGHANDPTGDKGTATPVFVVPPQGNLVSGNAQDGILIDTSSQANMLNGNFVGTTASGDGALGNGADGVQINGASANSMIGCQFVNNPFVYYNVVDGNGANGLHVTNAANTTVQGNFFGIGANNAAALRNAGDGILVDGTSSNVLVGGVIPLGNVAAGNGTNGIEVAGATSGFTSFNTFAGLAAFGGPVPNANDGILVSATGGNQTLQTNVVSGNLNNGIELAGNASGVTIEPDIVGANTVGMAALPNGNDGILIGGTAHANVVGGYTLSVIPQNVISGNGGYGIAIVGQAYDNQIINSFIGTNVVGEAVLATLSYQGNKLGGIYVGGTATSDLIGGVATDPSQPVRNVISGNAGNGVTLAAGTSSISVVGNVIGLDRLTTMLLPNAGVPVDVDPASTSDTVTGNVTTLPM
ncbi:MAG TPA: right-handed parallel beta-helix repeat-containing protein [Candidatus Sulfotelmatobacter sp.]|nr:right-handed parallel beta-helix repeat-containing protein [Candidatus Sulfotelmatobacter sp.]